jgi:hypothetical protein
MSNSTYSPVSASAPALLVTGTAAAARFFVNNKGMAYAEAGYAEADIARWHVQYEEAVKAKTADPYANGVTAASAPVHASPPVLTGAGAGAHAVPPSLTATPASSPLKRSKGEDGNIVRKKAKKYKEIFEQSEAQRALDREEFAATIEVKEASIKLLQGQLATSLGVQADLKTKLQTLLEVQKQVAVLTQMNVSLHDRVAQAMGQHDVSLAMLQSYVKE